MSLDPRALLQEDGRAATAAPAVPLDASVADLLLPLIPVVALIAFAHWASQRLRWPAPVLLLLAGAGGGALGVLRFDGLAGGLADGGLLALMFLAGFDLSVDRGGRAVRRSLAFGLLTFALPFSAGILLGYALGFSVLTALLLGACFACHTLLTYPILRAGGLAEDEVAAVAAGGTLVTDALALAILAVVLEVSTGSTAGVRTLLSTAAPVALACVLVLFVLPACARRLPPTTRPGLLLPVAAVVLALPLHGILAAFLLGLAARDALRAHPRITEGLRVVPDAVLVPAFLLYAGALAGVALPGAPVGLAAAVVLGVVASKGAAAWVAARAFSYERPRFLLLWSLSLSHVGATLAVALAAAEAGLFSEPLVGAVLAAVAVSIGLATGLAIAGLAQARRLAPDLQAAHSVTPRKAS